MEYNIKKRIETMIDSFEKKGEKYNLQKIYSEVEKSEKQLSDKELTKIIESSKVPFKDWYLNSIGGEKQ